MANFKMKTCKVILVCNIFMLTPQKTQLRDDIVTLIRFWAKLNKESKILTKPYAGLPGLHANSTFSTLNGNLDTVSENGRDTLNDIGSHIGSTKTKSGTKSRSGAGMLLDMFTTRRIIAQKLLAAEIERFCVWLRPRTGDELEDSRDSEEDKEFKRKFKLSQDNQAEKIGV